jgi:7-keto-8-aminopelargonate synthetase-like enzyme
MTEPEPLQQITRTCVRFRGRKLDYFSGCDYFRLASHPAILKALHIGAEKFGLNVAASRLTTGNHALYGQLEKALADFFGAENAVLLSNGYLTNLVVAQALAGNFSHALLDARCHSSLEDAALFLDCPIIRFNHRDASDLASTAARCGPGSKLILLTDGMFAHDGSVAPLADYFKVLPQDVVALVDDAHGAGVLGATGQGSLEHEGVRRSRIIQTITLSKAFGTYGGAILGTVALRRRILSRSNLFVGNTPLPLPLANAAMRAVHVLKTDKSLRHRLARNSQYIKTALGDTTPGPIISLLPRNSSATNMLARALFRAAIYPPFIKYPGGPASGYFRFVISSEHTRPQLDRLLHVLGAAGWLSRPRRARSMRPNSDGRGSSRNLP